MKLPDKIRPKDQLEEAFNQALAATTHGNLFVAFFDGNSIKQINDSFGHLIGDLVIFEMARSICETVRDSDQVVRFGGDEFVVFISNFKGENIRNFVSRIQQKISHNPVILARVGMVTASAGVVLYNENLHKGLHGALDFADKLMYVAKKSPPTYLKLSTDNVEIFPKADRRKANLYVNRKRSFFNWIVGQIHQETPSLSLDQIQEAARIVWRMHGSKILHATSVNELMSMIKRTASPVKLEMIENPVPIVKSLTLVPVIKKA